jgi:hypothetical protein
MLIQWNSNPHFQATCENTVTTFILSRLFLSIGIFLSPAYTFWSKFHTLTKFLRKLFATLFFKITLLM